MKPEIKSNVLEAAIKNIHHRMGALSQILQEELVRLDKMQHLNAESQINYYKFEQLKSSFSAKQELADQIFEFTKQVLINVECKKI